MRTVLLIVLSAFVFEAYAINSCMPPQQYSQTQQEVYCIDEFTVSDVYELIVNNSLLSQRNGTVYVKKQVATGVVLFIDHEIEQSTGEQIRTMANTSVDNEADPLKDWIIQKYRERATMLGGEDRTEFTSQFIRMMLSVLQDEYAVYGAYNQARYKTLKGMRKKRSVGSVKLLPEGIVYAKIERFNNHLIEDLLDALIDIGPEKIKALMLDVRDDPGGILFEATTFMDVFLPQSQIIVNVIEKNGLTPVRSTKREFMGGSPVLLLGNGNSASAAELVMGSFQDNNRGIVVGVPSYGKGTIQEYRFLMNKSALKFTTGYWLTPLERSIDGVGVIPDVLVKKTDSACELSDGTLLDPFECKGYDALMRQLSTANGATDDSLANNGRYWK